ncbi:Eco57I restriction-modification methylase domain-containing protein [Kitasatospora sp. NPDC096147]|uniref:Eco57I restriction-modification methylase domain-containing protein n=1 Tax=Kitasatospora sp. NPDC096147 TaxID=3364093 RepID=UPI00381D5A72
MSVARTTVFNGVSTVGGLLPADMLARIATGKDIPGAKPADYRLYGSHESVRDAAERSWAYLRGVWQAYQDGLVRENAIESTTVHATGLTRERWLLPLFEELKFGRLPATPAGGLASLDGQKTFPVSHRAEQMPVHLVGWNIDLDHRTPGVAASAPQSMLQEYLNRSGPGTLWGLLSNGRLLRLLRDSTSMVGSAYVEFDLQAIFDGEQFAEFLLLYRLAHQSRFEPRGDGDTATPAGCWLERWRSEALESGTRALQQLRVGVQRALTTLGTGFLQHPDNRELRDRLGTAELSVEQLHRALLRTAYRLLFLFVAEDRDVLIPADVEDDIRKRYDQYFSSARLRRTAERLRGGPHDDQWKALRLVLDGLGQTGGLPQLGLPGLGGIFEANHTDQALAGCELANEHLFSAIRALSVILDPKVGRRRSVDYRHLGSEELGSVYESLLELIPRHDPAARTFELHNLAGNERKTTGSYYTPAALIESLLDSALDPVLDDAVKSGRTREEQEAALLALTICDPACGSGHFLVAAARRLAKRIAQVRTDDPEPSVEVVRTALRDVIGRCIYGVDLNELAVELAKVSLWLEALEPGKALNFLDGHVKQGNSLLGTTPKLLAAGVPDGAYTAIEGDDKKWTAALKKRNKLERAAYEDRAKGGVQGEFFTQAGLSLSNKGLARTAAGITEAVNNTLVDVHTQRDRYNALTASPGYVRARELADAWCSAFVWRKTPDAPPAITTRTLLDLQNDSAAIERSVTDEVVRLAAEYEFFHWHIEFPEVFAVPDEDASLVGVDSRTGWSGGFSCVLGNPPWERVKLQEQEFFASLHEGIANAPNKAARDRLIKGLASSDEPGERDLLERFEEAKRLAEGTSQLLRNSDRFPLAGRGDVNTYAVFAETASQAIGPHGQFGLVLPTGIATDATTAPFFSDLVRSRRLASFLDFENEAFILSRDVDHRVRFCLLTVAGHAAQVQEASFAFGTRYMADLADRRFAMPPEEILLVNPNTGTLPVFRSRRDAEITLGIYRRVPVLLREDDPEGNPWGLSFGTMFHMSNDSHLFRTREQLEAEPAKNSERWRLEGNIFTRGEQRMLPLYEAKMLHHFDHRLGTYEGQTEAQANMGTLPRLTPEQHDDPEFVPMPRYWVPEFDVPTEKRDAKGRVVWAAGMATRLADKAWDRPWLMGFRKICRSSDERTVLSFLFPSIGLGDSGNLLVPQLGEHASALYANTTALVVDYVLRQKLAGSNLNFFQFEQLAVLPPAAYGKSYVWDGGQLASWLSHRTLELTYTAHDMTPFARDLGDTGAPFRWDESRRELLRAELDAAFFHLYGVTREDVDYIMDTFPILKRKDEASHDTFRTKNLILQAYDAMTEAARTGVPYETVLSPPPGQGPRHAARTATPE